MTKAGWWSVVADLVCVLALAAGGYNTHDQGAPVWEILRIAWPFLAALALAWVLVSLGRRGEPDLLAPTRIWATGLVVLAVTYLGGMALRALSGEGMAPAFLIVSVCFLTLTMLGWRLIAAVVRRIRG